LTLLLIFVVRTIASDCREDRLHTLNLTHSLVLRNSYCVSKQMLIFNFQSLVVCLLLLMWGC